MAVILTNTHDSMEGTKAFVENARRSAHGIFTGSSECFRK